MRNRFYRNMAVLMTAAMMAGSLAAAPVLADSQTESAASAEASPEDQAAADKVAALIDKIYVQERTDTTDADCEAAKKAWDALTDTQKALVEGENASPEYFGRDTGDASKDDPLNEDNIGENELLLRHLLQRQPCRRHRRHREGSSGSISGLVRAARLHRPDHHQSHRSPRQ